MASELESFRQKAKETNTKRMQARIWAPVQIEREQKDKVIVDQLGVFHQNTFWSCRRADRGGTVSKRQLSQNDEKPEDNAWIHTLLNIHAPVRVRKHEHTSKEENILMNRAHETCWEVLHHCTALMGSTKIM